MHILLRLGCLADASDGVRGLPLAFGVANLPREDKCRVEVLQRRVGVFFNL